MSSDPWKELYPTEPDNHYPNSQDLYIHSKYHSIQYFKHLQKQHTLNMYELVHYSPLDRITKTNQDHKAARWTHNKNKGL